MFQPDTQDVVQTFVSLLRLSQIDLGDGFEVDVPQSDAAVPSSGGEPFLTCVHAEDPCLHNGSKPQDELRVMRFDFMSLNPLSFIFSYPVCGLDSPGQSDSSPHVHISVQSSRVRQLVFGCRNTQDGLQVARLPKHPSLRSQSVPTESPELQKRAV